MEKNHQQKINFPWTIEGWPWAPDFSLDLAHANSSKKQKGTFCQHEAGTFLPQIFLDTSVMLPLLLGAWNWPVLNSKLLTDLSGDCTTPSGWEGAFHQKFFRIPYMDTYILYIYTIRENKGITWLFNISRSRHVTLLPFFFLAWTLNISRLPAFQGIWKLMPSHPSPIVTSFWVKRRKLQPLGALRVRGPRIGDFSLGFFL